MTQHEKKYGFHIDRDPSEILERYGILGEDHARKKARLLYLEDVEKSVLAEIKNDIRVSVMDKGGKEPTDAKLLNLALIDGRYVNLIDQLKTAREESLIAEISFKKEDKRIELIRSLETSVRMQMERFGG